MNFDEHTGLLWKALRFSAEKHRDQRRKDVAASPYINHPITVAESLWAVGAVREADVLVAALLHDTIEDTGTRPEEIRSLFGDGVLGLVLEVSDDKSLPKAERKRLQIETARHKSRGARLIKLADLGANLHDMLHAPPEDWPAERIREYVLWTEQVVTGLRGTHAQLESRYDALLAEAKQKFGIKNI